MKKLLSMLLCAVMTVTCIGAVPAHAASSDTRLRVGLTISGASTCIRGLPFFMPSINTILGSLSTLEYTRRIRFGSSFALHISHMISGSRNGR